MNKVFKFIHGPAEARWDTVMHILCYLKATTFYDLHITRSASLSLHGFTYVDWASNVDDKKSTDEYFMFYDTTPIS